MKFYKQKKILNEIIFSQEHKTSKIMQWILYIYQKVKKQVKKQASIFILASISRKILRCVKEKFLPEIMDAFTVHAVSPVSLPFLQSYRQGGRQIVALSLDLGTQVSARLARNHCPLKLKESPFEERGNHLMRLTAYESTPGISVT